MNFINLQKSTEKTVGRVITFLICALVLGNFVFYDILSLPKKQVIAAGSELSAVVSRLDPQVEVKISGCRGDMAVSAAFEDELGGAKERQTYEAAISVCGLPLKTVSVEEAEPFMVEPGGQSIGILLQTDGVSVVGFSPVVSADGSTSIPASEAGLNTGDFITDINGQKVNNNDDVAAIIEAAGQEGGLCKIAYLRNGIKHTAVVTPQFCADTGTWRIGLYVRDNTAGIGTLSFYEPDSGIYGALGHEVPDLEYGVDGETKGCIVRAAVQDIKEGTAGAPGEKVGVFLDEDWQGSITTNSTFGIFGELSEEPETEYSGELLPVALISEVEAGPAQIYTVVDGETVEAFDIEILKCMEGCKLTGKGMVIKVTDEDLFAAAGGIVQGMSGSPIIQNGKFVGAVTHVFINDPACGYACFGQWMLEDAGLS